MIAKPQQATICNDARAAFEISVPRRSLGLVLENSLHGRLVRNGRLSIVELSQS
jgi:hypothetical protein